MTNHYVIIPPTERTHSSFVGNSLMDFLERINEDHLVSPRKGTGWCWSPTLRVSFVFWPVGNLSIHGRHLDPCVDHLHANNDSSKVSLVFGNVCATVYVCSPPLLKGDPHRSEVHRRRSDRGDVSFSSWSTQFYSVLPSVGSDDQLSCLKYSLYGP